MLIELILIYISYHVMLGLLLNQLKILIRKIIFNENQNRNLELPLDHLARRWKLASPGMSLRMKK